MTPVPRLATCMSNCDNLNVVATFSIHHEIGEPPKRDTTRTVLSADAWNGAANPWMTQDQVKQSTDFREKSRTQSPPLHLVPGHSSPQFVLGRRINTETFHLESSSFSMRRRTSCQSEVAVSPASSAAQRRSISAAHASSASGSTSRSRLCSRRVASSARWSSGSARASSRIRSVISDTKFLYHQRDTSDRLTAN